VNARNCRSDGRLCLRLQHDGGVMRAIALAVMAGMFALSGCASSSTQVGRNEAIFVCKQVKQSEKINPNDPHQVANDVVFFAGDAAAAAGKHDPRWKTLSDSVTALTTWLHANSVTVTVTGSAPSPSPVPGLQRLEESCADPIHPVAP
jgi:hypothetical protein